MNANLLKAIAEVCETYEEEINEDTEFWLLYSDLEELVQIYMTLESNPYM